jgi:hypothetical protein
MPSFTEYQDVEMEIEIDPSDYLDACDKHEIDELIEELVERGFINNNDIIDQSVLLNDLDFVQNIMKLANPYNRMLLTVEEEQILEKMASRFL